MAGQVPRYTALEHAKFATWRCSQSLALLRLLLGSVKRAKEKATEELKVPFSEDEQRAPEGHRPCLALLQWTTGKDDHESSHKWTSIFGANLQCNPILDCIQTRQTLIQHCRLRLFDDKFGSRTWKQFLRGNRDSLDLETKAFCYMLRVSRKSAQLRWQRDIFWTFGGPSENFSKKPVHTAIFRATFNV